MMSQVPKFMALLVVLAVTSLVECGEATPPIPFPLEINGVRPLAQFSGTVSDRELRVFAEGKLKDATPIVIHTGLVEKNKELTVGTMNGAVHFLLARYRSGDAIDKDSASLVRNWGLLKLP